MVNLLTMIVGSAVKESVRGINKRLQLFPFTPMERTVLDWVANTLLFTFWVCAYIGIWKLYDPQTFKGNLFLYVGLSLLIIAFLTALAHLCAIFITEKTLNMFVVIIIFIWHIFSGGIPWDKISPVLGKLLSQNWIEQIFVRPYHLIDRSLNLSNYSFIAICLLIATVLSLALTITILNRKEAH